MAGGLPTDRPGSITREEKPTAPGLARDAQVKAQVTHAGAHADCCTPCPTQLSAHQFLQVLGLASPRQPPSPGTLYFASATGSAGELGREAVTCGKSVPFSVLPRSCCLAQDKSLTLSDHSIRELGQTVVISKVPDVFWFHSSVSPLTNGFFVPIVCNRRSH